MLKTYNIICISSIDWDFVWQQHQTIMSTFAKNGNRVLFIENTGVRAFNITDVPRLKKRIIRWIRSIKGFKKEMDNLYVYSPIILPFPYLRPARWINRYLLINTLKRWMKAMDFYDPIIWTFLPTPIVLDLKEAIPHKAFVYYCTDNFAATSRGARKVVRYERQILRAADAVFVMSKKMSDDFRSYNKNVTCIPMGVDIDTFVSQKEAARKPAELDGIKNRIVGFVGGVRGSIDQKLIDSLVHRLRDFTFVFIGPLQTDISTIKENNNIIFVGQKRHDELPSYIKYFDVSIIPYHKDDYTDNISPAKLNEYLIMGKPVIATNLREIQTFNEENGNILYIANGHQDFADLILKAISEDSDSLRKKRIEAALNNGWGRKIDKMSDIIEDVIKEKESENALNWQKRLLEAYKVLKGKTVKTAFILSLIYMMVLYTPLIWFLGEPLKISETPKEADAIVVFGGGVGEKGSPSDDTIERARFSVGLYAKGLARHIIYSSGYTYKYNDAENMKLFAISMGVPASNIILEQKANSCYENVRYTNEILRSRSFRKIILVSSPYNMRRASLVFKNIAKGIEVIYVPVSDPRFFYRYRHVRLEQINTILHEYLGIAYYFVKGYI